MASRLTELLEALQPGATNGWRNEHLISVEIDQAFICKSTGICTVTNGERLVFSHLMEDHLICLPENQSRLVQFCLAHDIRIIPGLSARVFTDQLAGLLTNESGFKQAAKQVIDRVVVKSCVNGPVLELSREKAVVERIDLLPQDIVKAKHLCEELSLLFKNKPSQYVSVMERML